MSPKEKITLWDFHGVRVEMHHGNRNYAVANHLTNKFSSFRVIEPEQWIPDLTLSFEKVEIETAGKPSFFAYVPNTAMHKGWFYWNEKEICFRKNKETFSFEQFGSEIVRMHLTTPEIAEQLLEYLLAEKLADRGLAFVHSSGVSKDGKAILFGGWGHSGKTSLALNMVNSSYNFLGDDVILVSSDRFAWAYPRSPSLFQYDFDMCPFLDKEKLCKAADSYVSNTKSILAPTNILMPSIKVESQARISVIFLLNKWDHSHVEVRNANNVAERLLSIGYNELGRLYALSSAFDYVFKMRSPGESNANLFSRSSEIVRSAFSEAFAKDLFVPRNPMPMHLVLDAVKRELPDIFASKSIE